MNELIMELDANAQKMWTEKPADIDRMLRRKGARGSNLTIVAFVKMDTQGAANILYMLYGMACQQEGDLDTLKKIMIDYLVYLGDRFQNYYKMDDSYCVAMQAAVAAADLSDFGGFAQLARAVQRYFGQLSYWVDFSIPWHDLSIAHAELIKAGHHSL